MTGYFGIGIAHPKFEANMGTLWRTALSLGASFTFQIGAGYRRQSSDTSKSWRHLPHHTYDSIDEFRSAIPYACVPVAVENSAEATPIERYHHPERAVYLLGPEDNGLSPAALAVCRDTIIIPGRFCLNVAVAGSIVLFDRQAKALVSA